MTEFITFSTLDLRDGQVLDVSLRRDIIIGHQSISNAYKEDLKLKNDPSSHKHIAKLKEMIMFYSGSMETIGFHLVTNTKKEIEEAGVFEYIRVGKSKDKKEKVRLDETK